MVFRYINISKVQSDDCWNWEPYFRVCAQKITGGNQLFLQIDETLVVNEPLATKLELNTNWGLVEKYTSILKRPIVSNKGLGGPLKSQEQYFLIKDKIVKGAYLHECLNCVITYSDVRLFDSYEHAMRYINSAHRQIECSLRQKSETMYELIHDFEFVTNV